MYPKYNVTKVLHSFAGSAISNISQVILNTNYIIELRKAATVVCQNFISYPKCLERCLFDIYNDPCETTDVSLQHPDVSINLFYYNKKLVNCKLIL